MSVLHINYGTTAYHLLTICFRVHDLLGSAVYNFMLKSLTDQLNLCQLVFVGLIDFNKESCMIFISYNNCFKGLNRTVMTIVPLLFICVTFSVRDNAVCFFHVVHNGGDLLKLIHAESGAVVHSN